VAFFARHNVVIVHAIDGFPAKVTDDSVTNHLVIELLTGFRHRYFVPS